MRLDDQDPRMDRQQIIALLFVLLMVGSMLVAGITSL